eukprot:5503456-Lingulodinium_polyedra.AAC.1
MAAAPCCGELAPALGAGCLARDRRPPRRPAAGYALLRRLRGAPDLPAPGELGASLAPLDWLPAAAAGEPGFWPPEESAPRH